MARSRIVVSVVGLPGSGKSIAAEMLRKRGFEVIELGDIWRDLLKKNHISRFDPIGTREFTRKMRQKYGKDVYARLAFRKIQKKRAPVAIMGIRSTYEMDYLKKRLKSICIIALLAPMRMRYGRLKARGKPEDPKNFKDFEWLNTREKRGFMKAKSEERHGIMHVMKDADYLIYNSGSIKDLEKNMEGLVKRIGAAAS